jgi:hypothetical protein
LRDCRRDGKLAGIALGIILATVTLTLTTLRLLMILR